MKSDITEIDNRLRDLGISDLALESMNLDRIEALLDRIDTLNKIKDICYALIGLDSSKVFRKEFYKLIKDLK